MRIKPHRLLFAALLAPAMISPAVTAQDAPEASQPTAIKGAEVIDRAKQEVKSQGWQLDIQMESPRRIELPQADGSTKVYWYIIYTVANLNTKEDGSEGVPVSTDLSFYVETVSGKDALNEPAGVMNVDDLRNRLLKEVATERNAHGNASEEEVEGEITDKPTNDIADFRYREAYKAHGNANNHFVIKQIAEQERAQGRDYFYWDEKSQSRLVGLNPLSAFQRHLGLIYDHSESGGEVYYSGQRALPKRVQTAAGANPELETVPFVYPGVDGDDAFVRYFTEDELAGKQVTKDEVQMGGVIVVKGPKSDRYGRLLKTRYRKGDVVGNDGRVIARDEPGYQQALSSFGRLESDGDIVTVAKVRRYVDGDKVLDGFDTGVKREDGRETFRISGRILDNEDEYAEALASRVRRDASVLNRGPDKMKRVNDIVGRTDNGLNNIQEVDSNTTFFGRAILGQPVKLLDRKGRPITMGLVTYQVGDYVSKDEYNIWASRRGVDVSYDASGLGGNARPLTEQDFMVGAPKIRMGKPTTENQAFEAEKINRLIPASESEGAAADQTMKDYPTGRRYSPKDVEPDAFQRDADGTFTTYRVVQMSGQTATTTEESYYHLAPLGRAAGGAVPIPAFDHFDAWKDWVDPATNKRVPLTDGQGRKIRDRLGVIQYLKAYDYEWRYAFQRQPIQDETSHERVRDVEVEVGSDTFNPYTIPTIFKEGKTINAWVTGSGEEAAFQRIALRTVYAEREVDGKWKRYPLTQVVDKDGWNEGAFKQGFDAAETLKDYAIKVSEPGQTIVNNEVVMHKHDGWSVKNDYPLTQYLYKSIIEKYQGKSILPNATHGDGGVAGPSEDDFEADIIEVTGFDAGQSHSIFKTWERYTLPAPLMVDGKPTSREMVKGATGADSKAVMLTKKLISERRGVLILNGVDDGWDFLNVSVRGLRSNLDTSRFEAKEDGKGFKVKPTYKDWVYTERYSKPGDEYDVELDLIERKRGRWFLLRADGDE